MLKFAFVGTTGALLNLAIFYTLTTYIHIWYMISALVAIECSILWNFYLNTKVTFNYRFSNKSELFKRLINYHLSSIAGSIINISTLIVLIEFFDIQYLFSELLAIILAFGFNYLISTKYVWNRKNNI
jgi:dolichol-phosphate mannosyltransferase